MSEANDGAAPPLVKLVYRCIICGRTLAQHVRDNAIVNHYYLGPSEFTE